MTRFSACAVLAAMLLAAVAVPQASARIILTEVVPGVSTGATTGDTVELYNTGPGAADLTGWVLTDMDPGAVEGNLLGEESFLPVAAAAPPLAPHSFAVVVFVDTDVTPSTSWEAANYGMLIRAAVPDAAGSNMLSAFHEELVLLDPMGNAVDSVAWHDTGSAPGTPSDAFDDLAAITMPTGGYALALTNESGWTNQDLVADLGEYEGASVDFTAWAGGTTYGRGSIQRRSTAGVWHEAFPDGPAQWEAVERGDSTLGNFSDLVPSGSGWVPLREHDDLAARVEFLKSTNHPDRRIDRTEDTDAFINPPPGDIAAWKNVIAEMRAGNYIDAFGLALPLGYEVIEFEDTVSDRTYYILQERVEPGDPGFRGQGIYIFDPDPWWDGRLVLQAPHPINDSETLEQIGFAVPFLRPAVAMIAGTHRNNHNMPSLCDGTLGDGSAYRISDVAHHPDNFFHAMHEEFHAAPSDSLVVQLHGFTPEGGDPDVILSNGFDALPPPTDFTQILQDEINVLAYIADDGSMGGDLTEAAVYGEGADRLGGTNNIQGRLLNGVAPGSVCNTPAVAASGRFAHVEQDLDVREEPQHILDAMLAALAIFFAPAATPTPVPCCAGDADNSGSFVDASDFISVQANFGADGGVGAPGDADCSGSFVDAGDFIAVQANFGADCM